MSTAINPLPPYLAVRHDLKPGDLGTLIYLHGTLFAQEYGWDPTFEAYVATPMAEFAKSHSHREKIWIVEKEGKIVGSIAIVEISLEQALLRWVLLHPNLRGLGMGRILLERALQFCRESGYAVVRLSTVSVLTAAGSLYRSLGFQVVEEQAKTLWGAELIEQWYELQL